MKILKVEIFHGWHPEKDIVAFINEHDILREDILTITQALGNYTLFYYSL